MADINAGAKRQRLYQQVVSKILALIDAGKYPVGSRLPAERELAEHFGCSRPTIREAMIALEANNRVEVKIGSGVYVLKQKIKNYNSDSTISPFELIESRVLIEGEAAALAASMITDEQLTELEQALSEMKEENLLENEVSGADEKFHTIISQATHNQLFPFFIGQLWKIQEESEHIKIARQNVCSHNLKKRLSDHRKIFNALAKRDSHLARAAMHSHFSHLLDALHQEIEEQKVREVKHKISQNKKRFSLKRMVDN